MNNDNRVITVDDVRGNWDNITLDRDHLNRMTDDALDHVLDLTRQWAGGLWDGDPQWNDAHDTLSLILDIQLTRRLNNNKGDDING